MPMHGGMLSGYAALATSARTRLNLYCIAQARLIELPDDLNVGAIIESPCMMLRSLPGFQWSPLLVHCISRILLNGCITAPGITLPFSLNSCGCLGMSCHLHGCWKNRADGIMSASELDGHL